MTDTNSDIPLFPLHAVLFPGGILPLRVFEARYLDMIGECMRDEKGFGICAIRAGSEVGRAADCHAVGSLVHVQDFDRGDDGVLGVLVKAERRFRIVEKHVEPSQLLRADIAWLDDAADVTLPENRRPLAVFLEQLLTRAGAPYSAMKADYNSASWVAGRLTELLPFALEDKQRLLEMDAPLARLETLYRELLAQELTR